MPKDPTRNVDRYKIRGGQLNAFEFQQNQGAVSEQEYEPGNWMGASEDGTDMSSDKAKAKRVRHLLAEHGEAVLETSQHHPEEYKMEQDQSKGQRKRPQAGTASKQSAQNDGRSAGTAATEEDFKPTHGRSPEVMKEMMQSRRRNDRVPDPEDIIAGHPEQSAEKKEHGITGRGTATRGANKQSATPKTAKSAKGKEAALDKSKPGVANGASAKKDNKQTALRGTTQQAATARGTQQTANPASTKQAKPSTGAKQAIALKGDGQAAKPKGATDKAAGNGSRANTSAKPSPSNSAANRQVAPSNATSGRAATATRSKAPAGKGR